ncbi:MAG: pentapeptide repeat-containing protein [Cyanobacteria bacterium J06639_16]
MNLPESGFERLKLLVTLSNANMPRKRKPDYSDIPLETQKRMGRYIPSEKSELKPKAPIPLRPFIWGERRLEAVLKIGISLPNADLEGANLAGADLERANLEEADL